jgi:hypothetical protein
MGYRDPGLRQEGRYFTFRCRRENGIPARDGRDLFLFSSLARTRYVDLLVADDRQRSIALFSRGIARDGRIELFTVAIDSGRREDIIYLCFPR